jgi:hypothetical protein
VTCRLFLSTSAFIPLLNAAPRLISQQPEFYDGWPTLARRKTGELLLVYSGGRESHICPFGRVELMRSSDEGANWSWPEVLLDSAIDDYRELHAVETAGGRILAHNRNDGKQNNRETLQSESSQAF